MLLVLFSQFGHAEMEEYEVSIGYSSDYCDDKDDQICITHFDELTNSLFKDEGWGGFSFSSYDGDIYNSTLGLQYLYCAALSEHVGEYKNAPIFYDRGMDFIDEYARKFAIRDVSFENYKRNLNPMTGKIPRFYQSWLVDDKDVLKGIIFSSISNVFERADIMTDGDIHKTAIKKKMSNSFVKNCMPLAK